METTISIWAALLILLVSATASMAMLLGATFALFWQFRKAQMDWAGTRTAYMEVVRDLARVVRFKEGDPQYLGYSEEARNKNAEAAQAFRTDGDRLEKLVREREQAAAIADAEKEAAAVEPGATFAPRY
ncbi:MAG: hypothetical protein ACE5F1_14290 [Planctomycetota bacterium]